MIFIKRFLLAGLIICCSFSFAQKKIDVKYFDNNIQRPIEEIRIFMVTKSDTISPKIVKGKIRLSKGWKDNFSLFAQINGKIVKIGSYRPSMFEELDAIIVGRINDFSTLKKSWEFNNTFAIGTEYFITIPNSQNILDVIYSINVKYVNVSLISDYNQYIPNFTYEYDVIKTKN